MNSRAGIVCIIAGLTVLAGPARETAAITITNSGIVRLVLNFSDQLQERLRTAYLDQLGPYQDHLWPIGRSTTPDTPFSSPYGPRLKASESYRYDWHRGVDIPAPLFTPVYAIASGTVTKAGFTNSYSDALVQLKHRQADGSGYYYSNYQHITNWYVNVGDSVTQGQWIADSGCSTSGFDHLHFEIRDSSSWQSNCVNPFLAMPYSNSGPPYVQIDSVDSSTPSRPVVQVTVTTPAEELDLNTVKATVYRWSTNPAAYVVYDSHTFDMMYWNKLHTPTGTTATATLDQSNFNGVVISPAVFSETSTEYSITLTFTNLTGPGYTTNVYVSVQAEDVEGESDSDRCGL
ncbi:MAG TPA: M23 family metallopeptidase [Kiritimatiellia bacterium]|nr:M23 family metallopeptidase [Kiritimatiellia bacterium]HRZ12894.1 M23 family metallopeptidase [Kiritimatiellia bacterium]HSA18496.1 M23 family metallopeptidase [Kiritimatiellia bacterium]